MFLSIGLLSWLITFMYFLLFINGGDPVIFINSLLLSILFTSFVGLKDKVKQQNEEIEELKKQLKNDTTDNPTK